MTFWRIIQGDCREALRTLDAGSVQTCVTSPPYFGLRDYGHDGQIGLEPTPDEFVAAMVEVFREVRRVLVDDGTVWLNLGDSYSSAGNTGRKDVGLSATSRLGPKRDGLPGASTPPATRTRPVPAGYKPKDLLGIPWMVAFALRADGWYLRSEIIWSKPACMPESVGDRPTKSHETVFLLAKSPRYFYDAAAIREPARDWGNQRDRSGPVYDGAVYADMPGHSGLRSMDFAAAGRNKRTVWEVATQPFPGAHFATFPPKLIEPCILAGSREGDTVLDPFSGSGTTGMVALRHGRSYIGCELNPEYVELSRARITDDAPLLNSHSEVAA